MSRSRQWQVTVWLSGRALLPATVAVQQALAGSLIEKRKKLKKLLGNHEEQLKREA
jgi:hypothetical protein